MIKEIAIHPDAILLRLPEVVALLGLSSATIHRMMNSGEFPRPVPISRRSVRWERASVEAWLDERRTASTETAAPQ